MPDARVHGTAYNWVAIACIRRNMGTCVHKDPEHH